MSGARNPLLDWRLERCALRSIGTDLQRPECVLAERDGTLWSAAARGGVMRIGADGAQQFIGQKADPRFAAAGGGADRMTYVISDRIAALTPQGEEIILFDDGDAARVRAFDQHFFAGTVTPDVMMATHGTVAPWMASLTFGGADLQTCYIGSLRGTTLPCFQAPVAGLPMVHWNERWSRA